MTPENTVFFSSCDDYYAVYTIASLLTVRDYVPKAKLALIGSSFSSRTIKLLERHNTAYYELDLSKEFFAHWPPYPVEGYYFAGPELFHKKGFRYSVYLDGDVLCTANPLTIQEPTFLAGVAGPIGKAIFIGKEDWKTIKKKWPEKSCCNKRTQAGVVYFNNKYAAKSHFLAKITELFKECVDLGIPRKDDDSLLALFERVRLKDYEIDIVDNIYNFVPQFNSWSYPINDLRFFHFSLDKPWKYHPYSHEDSGQAIFNPYVKQWRKKLFYVSKRRWLKGYISSELFYRLVGLSKKVKDGLRKEWQAFRGLRYHIWKRRKNNKKAPLKVFWANERINFGDLINADIIKALFGYEIIWTEATKCQLIGVGSILTFFDKANNSYVWGTGIIEDGEDLVDKMIKYCAVRGKLTRSRIGKKWEDIPLGDPGLLINLVYPVSGEKNHKIGVMPHYVDEHHPIIEKMRKDERFVVLSPESNPRDNAEQISQCDLLLSSSLHGLIFADSLGIPNAHIQLSDEVTGGSYKFKDYYSSVGRKYEIASLEKIFEDDYLNGLRCRYSRIKNLKAIQRKLIKSFPF